MMNISVENGKAYIKTPYNRDFVKQIKLIGSAKWDSNRRVWTVPEEYIDAVRKTMVDVYGESDIQSDEKIKITMEFVDDFYEDCQSVVAFGKTISMAFSRDSGAKVGEDVCYTNGEPKSGGSAKNWLSIVPNGSMIELINVNKSLYEKERNKWETIAKVNIKESESKLSELIKEKEQLLKRIASIDEEIKKLG